MNTAREPNYQEQSIIDFHRVDPASLRLYMTWDWHARVLEKYGITKDCPDPEVSHISKNKVRIDNASESCHTTLAFDPELMVRRVIGIGEPWELSFFPMGLY